MALSIEDSMLMAARNSGSVVQNIGAQKGLMTFDELRVKI
jgi:hypothetical protein